MNRKTSFLAALAAAALTSAVHAQTEPRAERAAVQARPAFVEIPGIQELSSRLIVRPLQPSALVRTGLTEEDAALRRAEARRRVMAFDVLRYVPQTDEYVVRVPAGHTELGVAESLMATGDYQYVEPDLLVYPIGGQNGVAFVGRTSQRSGPQRDSPGCPDDLLFSQQWQHQLDRMESCDAWLRHVGTPAISIGICDTGILTTHEDLQLHRLEAYNAVDRLWESEGGNIGPVFPHGTRTTGTAAANGNNGVGIVGVGWNLSHRMLRVSNQGDGGAFLSDLQHGARTSIESGDRIANVSYHGASLASNTTTATYIRSIGGLLLWSAGNTSSNYSFADRDADDLIVVGATDQNDQRAWFSSYGTFVDLFAPGTEILTSNSSFDSSYVTVEGTSYACPLVAGVCAMIWSQNPDLSPADVETILKQGAEDIGTPGVDDVFGYGRINLRRSLLLTGSDTPAADFSGQPTAGRVPLAVDFRDQSTGVPTTWSWDFGDGATSIERNPSHTYTALGSYTVSLSVSNVHGSDALTRLDFVEVDVFPPVADFGASTTAGLAPLSVSFSDESGGGTPNTWIWDFGDGMGAVLQNPVHTYTTSGFYTVTFTAGNAYGQDTFSRTDYIAVDLIPPVADFSATPTSGASPLVVSFADESTLGGTPTSWSWSFGDGWSSTAQHPDHTYTAAGTYSVSLTVSNAYGSDFSSRTGYVSILPGPEIIADFVGSPTSGTAPFQVDFTDLSIGNAVQWDWDFGDGGSSTLQHPSYVYTTPGDYNVNLTVTNPDGRDDSVERDDYVSVQ